MNSVWYFPLILTAATAWLYFLTSVIPQWAEIDLSFQKHFKFPSSLEELKTMAGSFTELRTNFPLYTIVLFCSAYMYKQTFSIPGAVFLNLLGGALYGPFFGFLFCCTLTTLGASSCFLLSKLCGKKLLLRYFPGRISQLRAMVNDNKHRLPYFLLSLRLMPLSPNWFMNVAFPIVGVPLPMFMFSVFFGLMPYNFIGTQAGSVLSELHSLEDLLTASTVFKLVLLAAVALGPSFLVRRNRKSTLT